jgi:hypothetical protein
MDYDISHLLDQWEYQAGQIVVRRFTGKDRKEKIQLRVDLGVLQMNADGRPDGKKPFGYASLLEYYQSRLHKYVAAHSGSDEGFKLQAEDCSKLQLEALQFHQRYFCLLQLEDYPAVVRDTERNLSVFEFVSKHAASDDLSWALRQFQPQLLMVLTRAKASQALKTDDYSMAIQLVEEGLDQIRAFYREVAGVDNGDASGEVISLETWLEEIRAKRPLSSRERLERALSDAVRREDYERAAKVRDELKNLESKE